MKNKKGGSLHLHLSCYHGTSGLLLLSCDKVLSTNFYCPAKKTLFWLRPQQRGWWTFKHTTGTHCSCSRKCVSRWSSGQEAGRSTCRTRKHWGAVDKCKPQISINKSLANQILLNKSTLTNVLQPVAFLISNRPSTLWKERFHFTSLLITIIALLERKAPRNANEIWAVILNGLNAGWKELHLPVKSKRKQPLNIHRMSTSEHSK